MKNTNNTKQCNIHDDMISSSYPEFKIVSIILRTEDEFSIIKILTFLFSNSKRENK